MKIRHRVVKSIRDFFDNNDFVLIDSPIFTSNAVEGTTNLFEVDYFERSAFLTQSGQLYKEAGATAFNKTYCFGPCFRAEKSKTRRHLTEFWMAEPEMAFVDLKENMIWAEKLVAYVIKSVLQDCNKELSTLERNIEKLEQVIPPFPKISYREAVEILKENGSSFTYGNDFGAPDETLLSAQFDKPVIIYNWPADIKAFYMKRDEIDSDLSLGMDMIAPEGFGEIVGGGQREENLDILIERIRHHDLPLEPFKWYLDLRKYGSVPHSGFGLGLERTVALDPAGRGAFASSGEDGIVHVWKWSGEVDATSQGKNAGAAGGGGAGISATLMVSHELTDRIITGLQYLSDTDGAPLALVGYDFDQMTVIDQGN